VKGRILKHVTERSHQKNSVADMYKNSLCFLFFEFDSVFANISLQMRRMIPYKKSVTE
jgi:hypothetical protein